MRGVNSLFLATGFVTSSLRSPHCGTKSQRFRMSTSSNLPRGAAMFARFVIPEDSIFYRTDYSLAFVNLRPIIPGHVLVIPKREGCPLLSDLTDAEYDDLWRTVRTVQAGLKEAYKTCNGFNVAVQDGASAGQSVPHAHVHILPRTSTDPYAGDDAVYTALEDWAPRSKDSSSKTESIDIPTERRDRTPAEMAAEAAGYRKFFPTS